MRRLIVAILASGLVFGTGAYTKALADVNVHLGKDRAYSSRYDKFSSWDARQRDRIEDANRDRSITGNEYDRLSQELGNVENFHDRAFSKGRISPEDQKRLERMEARLNADIDREIREHRG